MASADREREHLLEVKDEPSTVSILDLLKHHPLYSAIDGKRHLPCEAPHDLVNVEGKKVKKDEPTFGNQCAVRIAAMLLRTGIQIPHHKVLTCGIKGHEGHVVRARELATLIEQEIARGGDIKKKIPGIKPAVKLMRSRKVPGTDMNEIEHFFSKTPKASPGFIYINGYWQRAGESGRTGDHIDLWNGYRTPAKPIGNFFTWLGARTNYAQAEEVWFWEIDTNSRNEVKTKRAVLEKKRDTDAVDSPEIDVPGAQEVGSIAATGDNGRNNEAAVGALEFDRRQIVTKGVKTLVSAFLGGFIGEAHAQSQKKERGSLFSVIIEFGKKISSPNPPLKTIFEHPELVHVEKLSASERMQLYVKVALQYLTKKESDEQGLLSFPMVPFRHRPQTSVNASGRYIPPEELKKNPFLMLFDSGYIYWNAPRMSERLLLSPALWVHAARGKIDSLLGLMKHGPHSVALEQKLDEKYEDAGVLSFDEKLAASAHGSWANLLWLKNPDVTENGPADNNPRRKWTPQMVGGFCYSLATAHDLRNRLSAEIEKSAAEGGYLQELQAVLMHVGIEQCSVFMPASTDIAHFDNTMQQMTGAAVVRGDEQSNPKMIGQAVWTIPLKDEKGKVHLAILYTNSETTKKATETRG